MITIKLAEQNFKIANKYQFVEKLCRKYEDNTDTLEETFSIDVSKEEIEREQVPGEIHSQPYLESTAVYRKICEQLISKDIFLFHCAAIVIEGRGILFAAPSGTGKSTHVKLWKKAFGEKVTIINDDKPLIRIEEDADKGTHYAEVYGTPWSGKHYLNTNTHARVRNLVLLEQAKDNSIEKISMQDAYPLILRQTYRPNDPELMTRTLDLVNRFMHSVDIYILKCNISEEAVKTVYEKLFSESRKKEKRK